MFRTSVHELLEAVRNGDTSVTHYLMRQGDGIPAKLLAAFLADLETAALGNVDVIVNHRLPNSPKHVSLVLSGRDPHADKPNFVLVDLADASDVHSAPDQLLDKGDELVLHPGTRVQHARDYLADTTPELPSNALHAVAYVDAGTDRPWLDDYPRSPALRVYSRDDHADLQYHLRSLLSTSAAREDTREAGDEFERAQHTDLYLFRSQPLGKRFQRTLRTTFVLLDEQQVAYQRIHGVVQRAHAGGRRTAVIVMGGPGTGKSAVALALKRELEAEGLAVEHATGSRSFTNTLRTFTGSRSSRKNGGFNFFNSYMSSGLDGSSPVLDALICDEAHRIREKSYTRFATKEQRAVARRQIDELLAAARVPVFLLDENQQVRPNEIGSRASIEAAARAHGYAVEVLRLGGQFRCGGSDAFEHWASRLLGLHPLPPVKWSSVALPEDHFEVASAADPVSLEAWLAERQDSHPGTTARIAAGFCWPWSDPVEIDGERRLVEDVEIGGWTRPWNAKPEVPKPVPGIPASHYWATDPRGFSQIGCVYTAQGFEYDWAGLIFGPDLVRRNGRWVALKSGSEDKEICRKSTDEQFHRLITQAYKVLLTRGMDGACLYSTDPETQEFLEAMTG